MSNSGKSAAGRAEYRLTLSNRPSSSTSCPERSQRFVHESWRVQCSCDRLIPANQPYSTIFSSVFSCQQCCQPRAARCPSRFSTHKSLFISIVCRSHPPATYRTLHQVYPSIAEQFSHLWHAPTRRMRWVFVHEMSTHAQLSRVRFDARLSVLSLFVLRLLNLLFRSFLTGVQ